MPAENPRLATRNRRFIRKAHARLLGYSQRLPGENKANETVKKEVRKRRFRALTAAGLIRGDPQTEKLRFTPSALMSLYFMHGAKKSWRDLSFAQRKRIAKKLITYFSGMQKNPPVREEKAIHFVDEYIRSVQDLVTNYGDFIQNFRAGSLRPSETREDINQRYHYARNFFSILEAVREGLMVGEFFLPRKRGWGRR